MTADQTMSDEDLKPPPRRLPVWATLLAAVLLPWRRRSHFGRLLLLPVSLTTVAMFSVASLGAKWSEGADPNAPGAGAIEIVLLRILLYFMILIPFAVACHRSILLGDHAVARFGFSGWHVRETRFLVSLVVFVAMIPLFFLPSLFLIVLIFAVFNPSIAALEVLVYLLALGVPPYVYLLGRFSLALPATAVDLEQTLASAWSLSLGNGWRLAMVIVGPAFAISALKGLITALISMVVPTSMGVFGEIGSYLFTSLAYYILFTVVVAGLSISFHELSGWGPRRVA